MINTITGVIMSDKIKFGQFFTEQNPFETIIFDKWYRSACLNSNMCVPILEPFAGACHIIDHVNHMVGGGVVFDCYDIDPHDGRVKQRDTLVDFPVGYDICITNPPYLGKSSATRMGVEYPDCAVDYADVYLHALSKALDACDYIAMIIPESFISQKRFKDRLMAIDSITTPIFSDTTIPVCVAYFGPSPTFGGYSMYTNGEYLGIYSDILCKIDPNVGVSRFKYNDQLGTWACMLLIVLKSAYGLFMVMNSPWKKYHIVGGHTRAFLDYLWILILTY